MRGDDRDVGGRRWKRRLDLSVKEQEHDSGKIILQERGIFTKVTTSYLNLCYSVPRSPAPFRGLCFFLDDSVERGSSSSSVQ